MSPGQTGDAAGSLPDPPMLRVVAGHPTTEELAALVVVLSVRRSPDPGPHATPGSPWADPARRLTGPFHDRGGWRASGLPR